MTKTQAFVDTGYGHYMVEIEDDGTAKRLKIHLPEIQADPVLCERYPPPTGNPLESSRIWLPIGWETPDVDQAVIQRLRQEGVITPPRSTTGAFDNPKSKDQKK